MVAAGGKAAAGTSARERGELQKMVLGQCCGACRFSNMAFSMAELFLASCWLQGMENVHGVRSPAWLAVWNRQGQPGHGIMPLPLIHLGMSFFWVSAYKEQRE